jgi:hypothetical protein
MLIRDTAIAGGFQMKEISNHEKLKWEFPLMTRYGAIAAAHGLSSGPLRTSKGKV